MSTQGKNQQKAEQGKEQVYADWCNDPVFGEGIKFYADWHNDPMLRTALHIQFSQNKAGQGTMDIELAPIAQARQSPQWEQKIRLQLSTAELTSVTATLLGVRKTAKASYHGAEHNKGFQVHSNPSKGSLFAVSQKGRQLRHVLDQDGRAQAAAFFLRRLSQAWRLDAATTMQVLQSVENNPNPLSEN